MYMYMYMYKYYMYSMYNGTSLYKPWFIENQQKWQEQWGAGYHGKF